MKVFSYLCNVIKQHSMNLISEIHDKSSERTVSNAVAGYVVPITALGLSSLFDTMKKKKAKNYEPIVNLEGEIWKPVLGWEGFYEVSNMGRVKSLNYNHTKREQLMKPQLTNRYLQINFSANGRKQYPCMQRVVYEAFNGKLPEWDATMKCDKRMEINHKDENKLNNRLDNLELITGLENINYGSRNRQISEKNINGKKSKKVYQYTQDGILIKIWPSARECQRNGFVLSCITDCCRNEYRASKKNQYKGYIWSYTPLTIESK